MARCPTCQTKFEANVRFCPTDGVKLVESEDLLVGGRYRIIRKVGEGGVGEVFECEHVFTHRRLAVKMLKQASASDPSASVRLQREAQYTTGIGHPNIVDTIDFGYAEDGRVYLVMEWLDGETLEERLSAEALDVASAVDIALQICKGLEEVHARGIVHRDLKPSNLFLVTDRAGRLQVKILDFGIAKVGIEATRLTATGILVGTPYYMAPEQAHGDAVDVRTDVYALGVILYEMLTGSTPFRGDSAVAILHQITSRPPEPMALRAPERRIPQRLATIVARCLEKQPAQRFATIREVARALEQALAVRTSTAHVPPVIDDDPPARASATRPVNDEVGDPPTRTRARTWIVAVAAAAGVVLAAGAIVLVAMRGSNGDAARPDAASRSSAATDGATATAADGATPSADAPPPVDATSPQPDASTWRRLLARKVDDHFSFVVSISPPRPKDDEPFQLVIAFDTKHSLATGSKARLKLARGREEIYNVLHPLEDKEARFHITLHDVVKHRATLELFEGGREIEDVEFELQFD